VETIDRYLHRLASSEPIPGGGSAAALVAAAGAALVAMVARICEASPKYAANRELSSRLAACGDEMIKQLDAARDRDEKAFARVVAAQLLPRSTEAEKESRTGVLEAALIGAAEEPLHAAAIALDVLRLAAQALEIPNRNLASDVGCAAEFGYAALAACTYNVRVNHRYIRNDALIDKQEKTLRRYDDEATMLLSKVRAAVKTMIARTGATG
jgi:methenyltetrahydrofolate cyclohydrolase